MNTAHRVLHKIRLLSLTEGNQHPSNEEVTDVFTNIDAILTLEPTEDKHVFLQFRIVEIKIMKDFLSSLPFDTKCLEATLDQHLSYFETTLQKEYLSALHRRILQLPSIYPDYFGFAIAKIKETEQLVTLLPEQQEVFNEILPQLLPPLLMLTDQTSLPYDTSCISEIIRKVQELQEVCSSSLSPRLNSLIHHISSIGLCYKDTIEIIEKAPSLVVELKAQLSGVGIGFFQIDQKIAQHLLCCNPDGMGQITHGSHPVYPCEGVFYKIPTSRFGISPAKEFATYSLYNILRVGCIAPVALLKIQNVIKQGDTKIYEKVVQGSYGVDGILLKDAIDMVEIPVFLRNCLGDQSADEFLELLFTEWFVSKEDLLADTNIESLDSFETMEIGDKARKLVSLYEDFFINIPADKRCFDFRNIPSKSYNDFRFRIDKDKTCQYLLEALWLIKKCPELCTRSAEFKHRQNYNYQLVDLCSSIHKIKILFPELSSTEIVEELKRFWKKFDKKNFSAHFLGALLTNPFDHRSANLMVALDKDNGKIQKATIVGIDNDQAFEDEDKAKTIIYLLPFMDDCFHESVLQDLLQKSPEILVLDWLIALEQQNERYRNYQRQKILTITDLTDGENGSIPIPFKLDSSVVPNIYRKLTEVQDMLRDSPDVTHWDILTRVQPRISEAYKTKLTSGEKLDTVLGDIATRGMEQTDVVDKISNIKQPLDEVAASFILSNMDSICDPSFDPVVRVQLTERFVRYFPGQANAIQIPGSSGDASRLQFFQLAVKNGCCTLVGRLLLEEQMEIWQGEHVKNQVSILEQRDKDGNTPFLIASSLANVDMMQYLIYYGCNTLVSNKLGKTCLSLIISCLEHNPKDASAAIRVLGKYSNIPWNFGWGRNMINPLHSLVELYPLIPDVIPPLLVFLISKGASPDLVDRSGFSPLDYAMEANLVEVVQLLIQHGAGRTLDITLAETFFTKNSLNKLHSDLAHYSLLLRWNLALQSLRSQSVNGGVCIKGAQLGEIFLPPDIEKKLFDIEGNIVNNIKYGCRKVHYLTIGEESYELYFKQQPELPGIEYAVDILFELLIGHGTSYTDLAKVSHPSGKTYPVLISQGIQGENLHDVLKDGSFSSKKLNEQYFSELLIASLLVNFEDGKPDNFILEELPDGTCRLVGIDNDHAFVAPVRLQKEGNIVFVKCFLYCLDNMKSPIHPKAREKFLAFSPERILKLWLEKLEMKHDEYMNLFPNESIGKFFKRRKIKKAIQEASAFISIPSPNPTFISIPFPRGAVVDIYQKFTRIQNCLRESNEVTGMQLLRAVIPEIGVLYEEAFTRSTPLQRFKDLTQNQYHIVDNRHETLYDSRQILKSMKVSYEEATIGPKIAKEELEALQKEIEASNRVSIRIQKEMGQNGDVGSFRQLRLDTGKEKVINGVINEFPPFDFSLFDRCLKSPAKIAKRLETVLCGGNYRSLHIHRCNFVETGLIFKTNLLRQITLSSPQLVSLELVQCRGVDVKMLQWLSGVPCLSSLRLVKMLDLKGQLPITFRLRSLEIADCHGINVLKIPTTLKRLTVRHCYKLSEISAHFIRDTNILDEEYRLEFLTLIACPKHKLWKIFTNYLGDDNSHFIQFKKFSLHSMDDEEHFFDILWRDLKNLPKALMTLDLCNYFGISFDRFFNSIFERYQMECQDLAEPDSIKRDAWYCVRDYATAFDLAMSLSDYPIVNLNNKQVGGEIPREFGKLLKLRELNLNNNQLTGEIPHEIFQLVHLDKLDLNNNYLIGMIHCEFSQLSNLRHLNVSNNLLTGEIPHELGLLYNLEKLFLNTNKFTGTIPSELGQLSNLKELNLDNNQLTGEIPPTLGLLSKLTHLELNNNLLTGEIPREISQLSNLRYIFLNNNQLTGEIPSEICLLSCLIQLNLDNNQLTEEIPSELGQLSNLSEIDLSNNQLLGEIPRELGRLPNLWRLNLSNNQLSGEIPLDFSKLSNLSELELNNNQIIGEIPQVLGQLPDLESLNLDNNWLTGTIPPKLVQSNVKLSVANNLFKDNVNE